MKHKLFDIFYRADNVSLNGCCIEGYNHVNDYIQILCWGADFEGLKFEDQDVELKAGLVVAFDSEGKDYEFLFTKVAPVTDEDFK